MKKELTTEYIKKCIKKLKASKINKDAMIVPIQENSFLWCVIKRIPKHLKFKGKEYNRCFEDSFEKELKKWEKKS